MPSCPTGYNCDLKWSVTQNAPDLLIVFFVATAVVALCVTLAYLWRNRG